MNFLSLLQQISSAVPRPEDTITVEGQPIQTPEWSPPPPLRSGDVLEPDTPPLMGNRAARENAYEAVGRNPNPRRGLRGLLDQIIGTAGDMGRAYTGQERLYAQQQERRRLSDAMIGWTASPEAGLAAAERAAVIDPEAGRAIAEQVNQERLRQSQIDATAANNQAMNDNRAATRARQFTVIAGSLFSNPNAYANGVITPMAYERAVAIARANGVDPAAFGITPDMTAEEGAFIAGSGINPYQRETLSDKDVQLGISQQNADANTLRASREPVPRQPRQQTRLEYQQQLMATPMNQRTPEEQAWLDNELGLNDTRPSRSVSRSAPASVTTRSGRTFTPVN